MRFAAPVKTTPAKTEQIVLFRVSGQLFAISSASVQECAARTACQAPRPKSVPPDFEKFATSCGVGQVAFHVNGAMHFGLHAAEGAQLFVLRKTRTALLIDGIEKMTTMSRLQALPLSFCHEERQWYRGLTALDQTVVPVVHPEGFLSPEELALLDAALLQADKPASEDPEGTSCAQ